MMDETELAIVSAFFFLSMLSYSYIESLSTDLRKVKQRAIIRKNFSIIAIRIQMFPALREILTTAKSPVVLSPIPRGITYYNMAHCFIQFPLKFPLLTADKIFIIYFDV